MSRVTGLAVHAHHLWRADQVRALADDSRAPVTFFCGGSRNVDEFIDVFDAVFVLDVDLPTLRRRLDSRPADECGGAGRVEERELIERLHLSGNDVPSEGVHIDATAPLREVVDEILHLCGLGFEASRD
ncbi:nucleoside kinase [Microbacterium invictum]|uniref:Nucleoside kinase n=1 Tax=Microbacterium invictum TaxID=515415 RepID=A0ABZ0VBC6_9MICO|nr:nucleoside kinase [Microbacterium invictum]WQB70524.1 nucleoside kinase [Microbacterium invictum]